MSTETLIKENSKDTKLDTRGPGKIYSDPQISNIDLNKLQNNILKKKKIKTCIKTLQEKLRKKEVKKNSKIEFYMGYLFHW